MNCLSNICYVCLKEKDKPLNNINSSSSVNKDIIHILGYPPFNLGWMKTKQIILICEECCRRLRETYRFLAMCHNNSALMQSYMDKLNTASISNADNEAQLRVDLNDKIKCEIKLEYEEIHTVGPIIEETEEVFMNVDDAFVKEEDTWKTEALDDEEEPPMENNSAESSDNETDTEISENTNTHDTDTHSDSSGFTSTQGHTTNKKKLNSTKKSYKCVTCNKSFSYKTRLQIHTRVHTGGRQYKCVTCKKCFRDNSDLRRHVRTHTGERPYECSICKKWFIDTSGLAFHMRIHNDVKPYKCDVCEKWFSQRYNLLAHMLTHTGEKPYKCSRCNKSFGYKCSSVLHLKKCAVCCEDFCSKKELKSHMLVHADQ